MWPSRWGSCGCETKGCVDWPRETHPLMWCIMSPPFISQYTIHFNAACHLSCPLSSPPLPPPPPLPSLSIPSPSQNCLPPLHHLFVVPYIPSGFWTRLIARIVGDASLVDVVKACFNLKAPGVKSFFGTRSTHSSHIVHQFAHGTHLPHCHSLL